VHTNFMLFLVATLGKFTAVKIYDQIFWVI
jgi:hypothetical protein